MEKRLKKINAAYCMPHALDNHAAFKSSTSEESFLAFNKAFLMPSR
jgi:hypothetical protein